MHLPTIESYRNETEIASLAYRLRQASQVLAFLVAALGLVVFCGWVFNIPTLTYIRPRFQSMKVNTALSFLFLGAGLWLAHNDEQRRGRRILGSLVTIIAGATLVEYAFHVSLGIDELLIRDTGTPSFADPGRMSIASAVCFLLLGLAVTFLGLKKAVALQDALVAGSFGLALVALCGYLYGVESLYTIRAFSTIGLHTASGFVAACVAYFLARPDEGIVSIAVSNSSSGILLRTLVPATLVVPILVGWLRLVGLRANLYNTPFGVVLQVQASVAFLIVLTVLIARSMYQFERELKRYRQHLEDLVRERTSQLEAVNAQLQSDIIERMRAEHALRQSESQFRSLFESSPIAVLMTMPDGRVLAANPAACAMFDMSEAEICLAGQKGLVDPSDLRFAAVYDERQRTGRVVAAEVGFIRGNGEHFPAELDSVILADSAPLSFVMLRDITNRKRAEAALLQSEKLASLGRMAAAIAHEINNPLAAVMNLLFLARETEELDESTRRMLEAADTELRRVAHIARQSLGFYRESNAPELISVSTVLDSVLDLLGNRIKAKNAIVEKQGKEDVQITAVSGELRQVFSNLVSNSLDAIEEGGTIKVRVSAGKQGVRVMVTDNGKGIPPSALKHIFEPFFTTKDRVGTGLGLWVSKEIIEKHGGKIQVRSCPEGRRRGTAFSVVLPFAANAVAGGHQTPAGDRPQEQTSAGNG